LSERKRQRVRFAILIFGAILVFAGLFVARVAAPDQSKAWVVPATSSVALPDGGRLFLCSVGLAVCATVFAFVLAFPVGVHLGGDGGAVSVALALVPLVVPPHLAAYMWRFTLDDVARFLMQGTLWRHSPQWRFFGAAWTLAALYWPVIALPIALVMRLRGNRLRQELATLAHPCSVFWRAVVPGLAPGAAAGAAVFFLLALSNYGVPLMWNVASQNVAVFARLSAYRDFPGALMLAAPLIAAAMALCIAGLVWVARRPRGFDMGLATLTPSESLRSTPRGFAGLSMGVLLTTAMVPVITLVAGPGVFRTFWADVFGGLSPYLWGLTFAALGATGATALGLALAQAMRHAHRHFRLTVEFVGLCVLLVPAAIVCMTLAGLLSRPGWMGALYDSVWIFMIAYGVRFFYIPWKVASFVQRLEGREHEDVKRLLGLGPIARARLAIGGMLRQALCVSWLVVFALTLGELEIATFLVQPGRQPISVFLDNLMHYGRSASIGQWSLIVVMGEIAIVWIVLWVGLSQCRRLRVMD